jgi:hypothetical protein
MNLVMTLAAMVGAILAQVNRAEIKPQDRSRWFTAPSDRSFDKLRQAAGLYNRSLSELYDAPLTAHPRALPAPKPCAIPLLPVPASSNDNMGIGTPAELGAIDSEMQIQPPAPACETSPTKR